jgi:hypothetical protein
MYGSRVSHVLHVEMTASVMIRMVGPGVDGVVQYGMGEDWRKIGMREKMGWDDYGSII